MASSGMWASARMYRCANTVVDDIGCPFVSSRLPLPGTSVTATTSVRPSRTVSSRSSLFDGASARVRT